MSTTERTNQIAASLRDLVAAYTKAMAHLEETLAVLCRELDLEETATLFKPLVAFRGSQDNSDDTNRPMADKTLLGLRMNYVGNCEASEILASGVCYGADPGCNNMQPLTA